MTPNKNYTSPTTEGMLVVNRMVHPYSQETFTPSMEDIITSLPKINRYNGYTEFPYSVAQHCMLCALIAQCIHADSDYIRRLRKLYMLLHDAAEAYLQDIVRPNKTFISDDYLKAEKRITEQIMLMYFTHAEMDILNAKKNRAIFEMIDTRMAVTEVEQLTTHSNPLPGYGPYEIKICEFDWRECTKLYAACIEDAVADLRRA